MALVLGTALAVDHQSILTLVNAHIFGARADGGVVTVYGFGPPTETNSGILYPRDPPITIIPVTGSDNGYLTIIPVDTATETGTDILTASSTSSTSAVSTTTATVSTSTVAASTTGSSHHSGASPKCSLSLALGIVTGLALLPTLL